MLYRIIIFCTCLLLVLLDQCMGSRILRRHSGITNDLPVREDLQIYLDSMRKLVEFTGDNKLDLDLNYLFGIFLLQVNLKTALKSQSSLTKSMSNEINNLLKENEKLIKYFKYKVETDFHKNDKKDISSKHVLLARLFENCKTWSARIPSLKLSKRRRQTRRTQYTGRYFRWPEYKNNIEMYDKWVPNPAQSDLCLSFLGENKDRGDYNEKCEVPNTCLDMLTNGTDFGYALLHRLVFLQAARYARGCSIFSQVYDDELRNKYCSMAYGEAERIVQHNFDSLDLLFEEVCLCSLDGHVEFLRRSWLKELLAKQSPLGCLGPRSHTIAVSKATVDADKTWIIMKKDQQLFGGHCDGHFTSIGAAAVGAAIRFILENN